MLGLAAAAGDVSVGADHGSGPDPAEFGAGASMHRALCSEMDCGGEELDFCAGVDRPATLRSTDGGGDLRSGRSSGGDCRVCFVTFYGSTVMWPPKIFACVYLLRSNG